MRNSKSSQLEVSKLQITSHQSFKEFGKISERTKGIIRTKNERKIFELSGTNTVRKYTFYTKISLENQGIIRTKNEKKNSELSGTNTVRKYTFYYKK